MSAADVVLYTDLDGETFLVGYLWIKGTRRSMGPDAHGPRRANESKAGRSRPSPSP